MLISTERDEPRHGGLFPTTRLTIMDGLRDPESGAWDTFFGIYGPIVFRMARHAGLPESDCDEVVGDVMRSFVRAVQGGFTVDHELGRFRSYLRTISNRQIAAQQRRRSGRAVDGEILDTVAYDRAADEDHWRDLERQERLRACLELLRTTEAVRPRDLEAFEEYVLLGQPAEQVARRYDVTVNRLYGIKHEMIRRMRRLAARLDEELGS